MHAAGCSHKISGQGGRPEELICPAIPSRSRVLSWSDAQDRPEIEGRDEGVQVRGAVCNLCGTTGPYPPQLRWGKEILTFTWCSDIRFLSTSSSIKICPWVRSSYLGSYRVFMYLSARYQVFGHDAVDDLVRELERLCQHRQPFSSRYLPSTLVKSGNGLL